MGEGTDWSRVRELRTSGFYPPLRVGDLVAEAEFGLDVHAGAAGLEGSIEGVHLSELPDPTPWMLPRSILLSTGLGLAGDATFGPRLVERLSARRMAGLVIALGHAIYELPTELVATADSLAFPLLTAPLQVPFRRITAFIYSALSSEDLHRLRRTLSIQNNLLQLMSSDKGLEHLIESVAGLLDCPVALVDNGGALICARGKELSLSQSEARDLHHRAVFFAGRKDGSTAFDTDHNRVAFREVRVCDQPAYVLLALLPRESPLPELGENVLSFAQGLVGTHALKERDRLVLWREMRSSLLDDLVAGIGNEVELSQRMTHCGFDPQFRWRLAICDIRGFAGSARSLNRMTEERLQRVKRGFLDLVNTMFVSQDLPALTDGKGDSVLALFRVDDDAVNPAQDLMGELVRSARASYSKLSVDVGVSSAGVGPLRVKRAAAQAREALACARAAGGGRVAMYDSMDPQNRLVGSQAVESLESIVAQTLGPLLLYDARHHCDLVGTVRAFTRCELNIALTAERLGIHRNTVRQRLDKAESLTGREFWKVHDVVDVVLGLHALNQLAPPDSTPSAYGSVVH